VTKIPCDSPRQPIKDREAQLQLIPDRRYFKIGEVCALTGVKQHVLRYWESEFKILNPSRAGSRQRLYHRSDIETILAIKSLLKEKGFTISGAIKALANETGSDSEPLEPALKPIELSQADMLGQLRSELIAIKKIFI